MVKFKDVVNTGVVAAMSAGATTSSYLLREDILESLVYGWLTAAIVLGFYGVLYGLKRRNERKIKDLENLGYGLTGQRL